MDTDFDATTAAGALSAVTVGAVVSTVKLRLTVGPALPNGSMAWTVRVCGPSARPVRLTGLVQVVAAAPSSEHQAVAVGSSTVKLRLAALLVIVPVGAAVTVTTGPVVSTVKLVWMAGPRLPTGSTV